MFFLKKLKTNGGENMHGKFFVFEGMEHSGKTTLFNALKAHILQNYPNKKFIFTREPGGAGIPLCENIRDILLDNRNTICPETEMYLYAASRAQHTAKIKEYLEKGYNVICDRYYYSSLIYQGIGRNLGMGEVFKVNYLAIRNLNADYVFYIDIEYPTYIERKQRQLSLDRLESEDEQFFTQIYDTYKEMFTSSHIIPWNDGQVIRINNGNRDLKDSISELINKFDSLMEEKNE